MLITTGWILESRYLITELLTKEKEYNLYLAEDMRLENTQVLIRESTNFKDTRNSIVKGLGEFKEKAVILVNQTNPGLPRFTDFFVLNSNFYLVMDYIEGNELENIISQKEEIEEELIASWFLELAQIFQHFHSQGLTITSDVLLKKLRITSDNKLKLASLGVEDLLFIPNNEVIREDIYQIGLILYFLLTGERFDNSLITKKKLEAFPYGLRTVLELTLQSDPLERPQNIEELVSIYEETVNVRGQTTRADREHKGIFKKIIAATLISISIFSLIVLFTATKEEFTTKFLVFTDENLVLEIRHSLGKAQSEPLVQKDVLEITELSLKEKGIESLEGIEYLKNLKSLNLSNNNISDIKAIGELPNLEASCKMNCPNK